MGPAESTKVNTKGIGGRQFLDFQDETTHQGGSGWEDQEEEDETREGESESEGEENYFFEAPEATMIGTQEGSLEATIVRSMQCAQPQISDKEKAEML